MIQAVSAAHMSERETDSELVHNQEQLDMDFLLNIDSDNELLNSPQQVYSVTISKFQLQQIFH